MSQADVRSVGITAAAEQIDAERPGGSAMSETRPLRSAALSTAPTCREINGHKYCVVDVWTDQDSVLPGESVTVHAIVENRGSKMGTIQTYLGIRQSDGSKRYPSGQKVYDIAVGERVQIDYTAEIPSGAPTGEYDLTVDVWTGNDAEMFHTSGWLQQFSVVEPTTDAAVTATSESGSYLPGDSVSVDATVENTGDTTHEFYVGYSVRGPDGNWYSNDDSTGTTVTLDPGETESLTLSWDVTDMVPTGTYDVRVSVWEESDRDNLETRLDRADRSSAFEVQRRDEGCLFVAVEDENGDDVSRNVLLGGTTVEYSTLADTSDDSGSEFCDTESSDETYMFVAPPGEYEVWVVDEDSPTEYWGVYDASIQRGEQETLSVARGGVYARDTSITSNRGSRRFAPDERADVTASVYNGYDTGDNNVRLELYLYERGTTRPNNPTATISGGSVSGGRNSEISEAVSVPDEEGTYEVVGHIETYLDRGSGYYLTDTVDFGEITVKPFEPPSIDAATPDTPNPILTGQAEQTFSVDVSDSDTSRAGLSYEWTVDGQTVSTGPSFTFEADRYQGGQQTVRVAVSDGSSRTSDATAEWSVEVVDPPSITDIEPGATEVTTGTRLSFRADATDPGGFGPLSYEWTIDGETFDGASISKTFQSTGTKGVELTVTNQQGVARTRTFTVDVQGPPTVQQQSPSETSRLLTPSDEQTFRVDVSDPDTTNAGLSYEWSVDGESVSSGSSFTFDGGSYEGGEHTVRVVVSDGSSLTDDDVHEWTVRVVSPPTVTELRPGSSEVTVGKQVTFRADATDPGDHTPLTYEWTIGNQSFDGASVERTFQSAGERAVELTVTNARGVARTRAFTVDVQTTPPEVQASLTRSSIPAGESVTLTATASDPADRGSEFRYEWALGTDTWSGREATISPRTVGQHTIELTVTNEFGTTRTETMSLTVRNDAPTVERIEPADATTAPVAAQAHRFAVDVTDRDAAPVTVSLSVAGSIVDQQSVSEPQQVSFRHSFDDPGDHTASITVTDAHGASETVSWNVAVQSRPPEITDQTPDRSGLSLLSGTNETFGVEATDPDGQPVTYQWYVDGTRAGSGTSYTHDFDRHGQYTVRVEASDPSGSTTERTWNVSVAGFREEPVIDQQLSSLQLDEQSGAETASISVTNPATNQRSALAEVILEVPDYVDVTGTGNVMSSSPSQYRINDTIAPGDQESFSVHFTVDDDLEPGQTISIDYSVFYRPQHNVNDIHIVENDTREITIATPTPKATATPSTDTRRGRDTSGAEQTATAGPGFGVGTLCVTVLGFALLARYRH